MRALLPLALLVPVTAFAATPFDGTWKVLADSTKVTGKPDTFAISNGVYACNNCVPPYQLTADGSDQAIPGHAYEDHEAVKIVGPSSVEITDKKAGKVMFKQSLSVSADGSKLTVMFTSYAGKKPVTGTYTETRIASAPAGAHAISGTWQQDSFNTSDAGSVVTLSGSADGLKMVWNGQTTNVKFDGKQYPTVGDPGKTMVAMRKVDDRTIEETDRRLGKVTDVIVWALAGDGKTINMSDTDPLHETKTTWVFDKQP
jgi:hypothetical protein